MFDCVDHRSRAIYYMPVLNINIIGAGRVGKTLGALLARTAGVAVVGICNQTIKSSQNAINFIGSGVAYQHIRELPPADITLLTTPDDTISRVVEQLCVEGIYRPNSIMVHCSGTLSCYILSPLNSLGYSVAGVHPLRSFSDPSISLEKFSGTYCAIEGDVSALLLLKPLLKLMGAITHEIDPAFKAEYHAAAVFASNYMVTLAQQSWLCMLNAGVDRKIAMNLVLNLMQGTVDQIYQQSEPAHALTGPIQRGDLATVQLHLNALSFGNQKNLYSILGQATLPFTQHNLDILTSLQLALDNNDVHSDL